MKAAGRRQKGTRVETETKRRLVEAGIPTRRVIGSGAHGRIDSRLQGDLQIGTTGDGNWLLTGEVKARKAFTNKTFEGWLAGSDVLILRKDGEKEPRVYMTWGTFTELMHAYYTQQVQEKDR